MNVPNGPPAADRVACATCLKEIPRSEAIVPEAAGYVAYFCGLDCYDAWKRLAAPPEERAAPARQSGPAPAPEAEVQLGAPRSPARDERIKRLVKQHPQRDEPRIDSVEPGDLPRS